MTDALSHPPARTSRSRAATPDQAARDVVDAVPLVMRFIRAQMRQRFASVPQFRTCSFVHRNPGTSLSALAAHLGVTSATASAIVERLVRRGLIARTPHPEERRKVGLRLTPGGSRLLNDARARTRRRLAHVLDGMPVNDLETISAAAALLQRVLEGRQPPDANHRRS